MENYRVFDLQKTYENVRTNLGKNLTTILRSFKNCAPGPAS